MKKNSSIDNFLNDQIADHSWLNNAKEKENAPFSDNNHYDKKPELAQQLGPQSPMNTDVQVMARKVAVVVNEVKRQLMLGKSLQHVKETVIDALPSDVKTAAKTELVKIAQEFP